MAQTFPSREANKFIVRMPDGMRGRIAASAKRNHRSMNSEIVHHLAQAFGGAEKAVAGDSLPADPATVPNGAACQGGAITHG